MSWPLQSPHAVSEPLPSHSAAAGRWISRWGVVPPASRRRVARLVPVDLAWVLGLASLVFLAPGGPLLVWPVLLALLVGWALLDVECARGDAGALEVRRGASVVGLVVSGALLLRAGLVAPVLGASGVLLSVWIGIACHLALRASRSRRVDPLLLSVFDLPGDRPTPPPPVTAAPRAVSARLPPAAEIPFRVRAFAGILGAVYVACGAIEVVRGTQWLGFACGLVGVFAWVASPAALPSRGGGAARPRLHRALGKPQGAPAVLLVLGALGVVARVAWLLSHAAPLD